MWFVVHSATVGSGGCRLLNWGQVQKGVMLWWFRPRWKWVQEGVSLSQWGLGCITPGKQLKLQVKLFILAISGTF